MCGLEHTYSVTNLLPATSMSPRSIPAVAILSNMDNTSVSTLDKLEDVFSAEPIPCHGAWSIAFYDNIRILDQLSQRLAILGVLLQV